MVKRRIDLTKISHILYSRLGNEIVLRISEDYDIRLIDENKDQIIEYILQARSYFCKIDDLKFYFTSAICLFKYTYYSKKERKKSISFRTHNVVLDPEGQDKMMNVKNFKKFIDKKKDCNENTEMLLTFLNNYNKITLADFNILRIIGQGGYATVYLVEKKDTSEQFA